MGNSYENLLSNIENKCTDLVAELAKYQDKDMTNAAQARRMRKATLELAALFKEFRKESIEHHNQ